MARIRMYTTQWCGYCVRAKALLDSKGLEYEEVELDQDPEFRAKLLELTGGSTSSSQPPEAPLVGAVLRMCGPAAAGSAGSTRSHGRRRESSRRACRIG